MGEQKHSFGAGMLRRAKRDSIRPYTLRVVRDHGGGLWTFESNSGQMYLAVLSHENNQRRFLLEEKRQAEIDQSGRGPYGTRSKTVRRLEDPGSPSQPA